MAMNYKDYYDQQREESWQYQDFICRELLKEGIVLQNLQSQKWQYKNENLLGLEIKQDKLSEKTGNLYIETAEKSDPSNAEFVPSGIYRNDGTWLYGIGTYRYFFIFSKKTLKTVDRQLEGLGFERKYKETSNGFLIPKEKAESLAERYFEFEY